MEEKLEWLLPLVPLTVIIAFLLYTFVEQTALLFSIWFGGLCVIPFAFFIHHSIKGD